MCKKTKIKVGFAHTALLTLLSGEPTPIFCLKNNKKKINKKSSFLDVSGLLLDGRGFLPKVWAELLLPLPAVDLCEKRAG